MGSVRKCGIKCHDAKRSICHCWCGGLFHGAGGKASREAFAREYGAEIPISGKPKNLSLWTGNWDRAIAAALATRNRK